MTDFVKLVREAEAIAEAKWSEGKVDPSKLVPGDWIAVICGAVSVDFVVVSVDLVGRTVEMVTGYGLGSMLYVPFVGVEVKLIGHTKIRWWWKYLGRFKSQVCPYPKPRRTR